MIVELVINGESSSPYRITTLPEDAILDASIVLTECLQAWWELLRRHRGDNA